MICACHWTHYAEAAKAADDILFDVFALSVVTKDDKNILTRRGFETVLRQVTRDLILITKDHDNKALKACLQALDNDWKGMSPAARDEAIGRAAMALGGMPEVALLPVTEALSRMGKQVVSEAKAASVTKYDLPIRGVFDLVDEHVVQHLAESQAHFVRDEYGKRVELASKRAREVVAAGVAEGLDSHDIGSNLATTMVGIGINRAASYWEMVSSVFAARSRSWGVLSSLDDAGIDEYQISSTLDAVTCNACRFMDGRAFSTGSAVARFHEVAESDDPGSVVDYQPWLGTARGPNGDLAIYFKQGDERRAVARVLESAVGLDNERGKFDKVMNRGSMEEAGISAPPFHARCRCTVVPTAKGLQAKPIPLELPQPERVWPPANLPSNLHELVRPAPDPSRVENPEVTPAGTPEEIAATNAKLKEQAIVRAALEKLAALPEAKSLGSAKYVEHGLPCIAPDKNGDYMSPFQPSELTKVKLAGAAKQKPKTVPIDNILLLTPSVGYNSTGHFIENPLQSLLLVKKGGVLYPSSKNGDQSGLVAAYLRGDTAVQAKVIDLDKAAKKPKAQSAPPVAAAKPMGDGANILHHKDAGAKGSNDGGFYTGADGIKRYVKFYSDPAQPYCEHLANTIYRDLGHVAPESTLFEHNGKVAYASELFAGGRTLSDLGGASALSKADAQAILRGFVGDVLTGNWDAVGTGFDNVMRLPDGRWVRIDNGGTFLMRAKEGRKPDNALNAITEWEVFFSSKNPYYSEVARKAGVSSPDDMKGVVIDEIRKVLALRDASGGWDAYVASHVSRCPVQDRARIAEMLSERSKLLEQKLAALAAPPKATAQPGAARYTASAFGTTVPRAGLTLNQLDEHDAVNAWRKEKDRHGADKMPSGETKESYKRRASEAMDMARADERQAVVRFTNGTYGEVRKSEEAGTPNHDSKLIEGAFARVPPEPGTLFRGIHLRPSSLPYGLSAEERARTVQATIDQFLTRKTWGLGRAGVGATSSSSWDIDVAAENFMSGVSEPGHGECKVLFKLNTKTGIAIETVSEFKTENEVLLSRHAQFRTTSVYRLKGYERILVIEADEVAP